MKVGDRVYSSKTQMTGTAIRQLRLVAGRSERVVVMYVVLDQMDLFLDNRPVWFYEKDLEVI